MSENERNGAKISGLTKEAKSFNATATNNTIQGMKTAALLDKQITEAERAQKEARKNETKEETPVPTGTEIRQAYDEGTYR